MWCTGQAVTGQGSGEVRVHFCVEAVTWNPRAGSHQWEKRLTNFGSSCSLYDLLCSFSVTLTPPWCYINPGLTSSLGFLLHFRTDTFIKPRITSAHISLLLYSFACIYTAQKKKNVVQDFCFLVLIPVSVSTVLRGQISREVCLCCTSDDPFT